MSKVRLNLKARLHLQTLLPVRKSKSFVMYTVLSSLAACGRLGVAAAGVLFWHAAS